MKLWLNDNEVELQQNLALSQALLEWSYQSGTFAVAINQEFVPKSQYDTTFLKAGDRVDVVTPMQGG